MATPDTLRSTKLLLAHGSGSMPALGFGTLIPDFPKTKQAVKDYQRRTGVAETGQIDTTLLAALSVGSH